MNRVIVCRILLVRVGSVVVVRKGRALRMYHLFNPTSGSRSQSQSERQTFLTRLRPHGALA